MLTDIRYVTSRIVCSIAIQMMHKYSVVAAAYVAHLRLGWGDEAVVVSHQMYLLSFPIGIARTIGIPCAKYVATGVRTCLSNPTVENIATYRAYLPRRATLPVRMVRAGKMPSLIAYVGLGFVGAEASARAIARPARSNPRWESHEKSLANRALYLNLAPSFQVGVSHSQPKL